MADPFSAMGAEESGARLAEKDQIFARKSNLEAALKMGELAMQPDEARVLRSRADLSEAQAGKFRRETAAAERLEAAAMGADLAEDPMERLLQLSTLAAGAGNVTTAAQMIDKIGLLNQRGAAAERERSQAELAEVNSAVKKQDFIMNRLGGATDQASWNQINSMYEQEFGEASPYAGMPFTPALAKQVGEQALSAKDRLKRKTDEILESGRNARSAADRKVREAMVEVARQRAETADRVATARVKAGGTARTPSAREEAATGSLLKEHLPGLDTEDAGRARRDIASRANEIRGSNKGIGAAQAIQMAFKEFQEAGVFEQGKGILGTGINKKTKYSSGGMSRETAIPMPRGSADDVRKALKKNRYYTTPRGLARWTGDAFETVEDNDEDEE